MNARDRWYWCIRDTDQRVIVMNLARPESEWHEVTVNLDGQYSERASGEFADQLVDRLNGAPNWERIYRRATGQPEAVIVEGHRP